MDKKKMIKSIEKTLYDQIIDFYEEVPDKKKTDIEKWKYKLYLSLMKKMDEPEEKLIVRNAMLLILSLFNEIPPDIYNTRGTQLEEISEKNRKEKIIEELRKEIDE